MLSVVSESPESDVPCPPVADADVPWLTDDEQTAWRAYLIGSRALEFVLDAELQAVGMSLPEYELLSMLSEAPTQSMRMSNLADKIVQSRSRVTHAATRLERRGWVERRRVADDGRGIELTLTPAGREAVESASRVHVTSVQEHLIRQMDAQSFQTLGCGMDNVRRHILDNHYNP